jgi:hypothetical protein
MLLVLLNMIISEVGNEYEYAQTVYQQTMMFLIVLGIQFWVHHAGSLLTSRQIKRRGSGARVAHYRSVPDFPKGQPDPP